MSNKRYLIDPLIDRAVASTHLPGLGLIDRAAEILIDKLGIESSQRREALHKLAQDSRSLRRCKWIDDELQAFFSEHPEGMAVELGAGFSTRFHRLSYAQEWPQFSWLAVDSQEVLSSVSSCIPSADNYRHLEGEFGDTCWLDQIRRHPSSAYIVIVESLQFASEHRLLKRLCIDLRHVLGHVHLIVNLSGNQCNDLTESIGQDVSLRNKFEYCTTNPPFLKRLIRIKRHCDGQNFSVCHLVLGKEPEE